MRMTFNSTQASGFRRLALAAAAAWLAISLVAGCGGGKDQEAVAKAEKDKAAQTELAADVPAMPPANAAEKESRMATAVVDGKTTAPVDMKYDLPSKPGLGEPFEVELAFDTRSPADMLEVEITEAPGLTIVGEKTLTFAPVEGGQIVYGQGAGQGRQSGPLLHRCRCEDVDEGADRESRLCDPGRDRRSAGSAEAHPDEGCDGAGGPVDAGARAEVRLARPISCSAAEEDLIRYTSRPFFGLSAAPGAARVLEPNAEPPQHRDHRACRPWQDHAGRPAPEAIRHV